MAIDQSQVRANFVADYTAEMETFLASLDRLSALDAKANNAGEAFIDSDFAGVAKQLDAETFAAVRSMTLQLITVGFNAGTSTTLASAITTAIATTLAVAGNAIFPTTLYGFFVTIDAEQMFVVSVSGTTWTVVRGVNGTTAATHLSGAAVTMPTRVSVMTKARR